MSHNVGKAVLGLLLVKSAVVGAIYLYNKLVKEDEEFSDNLKKDLKNLNETLSEVGQNVKAEAVALKDHVVEKAEDVLNSLKEEPVQVKETVKKATRKVAKNVAEQKTTAVKAVRKSRAKATTAVESAVATPKKRAPRKAATKKVNSTKE